jgi:hypothetical protein
VKYWEIIADNLKKAGWSLGWVSAVDSQGRTIWIADAHRANEKRFVARADEKLSAFLELEAATRVLAGDSDATKDVIERPLDVQPSICSVEQHAGGAPSRRTGATHNGDM